MDIKTFIKKHIAIFTVALIAIIVLSVIIKYNVEGETNLPFEVSKIMLISTAGGNQNEGSEHKWNLDLIQTNDVYIDIIKNKNYHKQEIIEKIIIDNLRVQEAPKKGQVQFYRLTNNNNIFDNQEEYKIEKEIQFVGSESSDIENLKIANQGGLIPLRFVNSNIGTYTSDEDTQITYDGTLLKKIDLTNADITFNVTFDILIELKSEKRYKATVTLEVPKGNLIEEGVTKYQIQKREIVFKRY